MTRSAFRSLVFNPPRHPPTAKTRAKGEDGLSASERLAIFDALPAEIRRVLGQAPYNYDVLDISRAWESFRIEGWTARRAALKFKRDFEEFAYQQQQREIQR